MYIQHCNGQTYCYFPLSLSLCVSNFISLSLFLSSLFKLFLTRTNSLTVSLSLFRSDHPVENGHNMHFMMTPDFDREIIKFQWIALHCSWIFSFIQHSLRAWVCFWKLIFRLHMQESFANCMMSSTLVGPNWDIVNCMICNQNYLNNHDRYCIKVRLLATIYGRCLRVTSTV